MAFLILAPLVNLYFGNGGLFSAGVLFALGAYLVGFAFGSRITLSENTIEERTVFHTKTLQFDEIRGRGEYFRYVCSASRNWKLVPNRPDLPTLRFGEEFEFDEFFYAWLNKLPSLDKGEVSFR